MPSDLTNLHFTDNPALRSRPDHYVAITVDVAKIMKSWRSSLFAFEWMLPDGRLKSCEELPAGEQARRAAVEASLRQGQPLEKPILGIGMMDNVEIGAGRAVFLTLAAHGLKTMPVHIPKTHQKEFSPFLA